MKYLEVGADNQLQHPFFIQQVTFDGRGGGGGSKLYNGICV